jgi:regulator of protease activity HflC (stomatin/prohibitin superfamily)
MNKFARLSAFIVLGIATLTAGCGRIAPAPGHEYVINRRPLIFGSGGVDPSPVRDSKWIAWSTTSYDVSMQPQQFEVQFKDLMSKDGIPLDFDSIIRLRVTDSVDLIRRFGPNWYVNNVEKDFMNAVRQSVRKYGMNETAINTSAIEAIDAEVFGKMVAYIRSANIPVAVIEVRVGRANPPDSIKDQRVQTAKQQQRIITEQQTKLAEDARKAAEQSRAAADNAYREAMSLSPEQFIQLEAINMQKEVCAKGHCTFISGSTSPIIGVR